MKVNVIDGACCKFEPVEFRFTCETEEDLQLLWHCFNISNHDLRRLATGPVDVPSGTFDAKTELWLAVNAVADSRGLRS